MKKLFVALSLLVFFAGCNKDPCKGVTCQHGGICTEGTCNCPENYEGTNCAIEIRAKYIGTFSGNETCSPSGASANVVTVSPVAGDVSKLSIANLYYGGYITTGTVQPDGTISISNQSMGAATINGSVAIISGKLKITYTITGGGATDACVWTQN